MDRADMTHPLTPREKVVLKPCPFCGGEAEMFSMSDRIGVRCADVMCAGSHRLPAAGEDSVALWNRRTALASGSGDQLSGNPGILKSGDHAELADLLDLQAVLRADRLPECSFDDGKTWELDGVGVAETFSRAADAIDALLAENAALRAERDQIAGESIWWKGVIGDGPYRPSGEVRSIKHLHPAMVKPIYEANKGTAVADVIAGLIFLLAINQNREQFLVADANERRTEAERKLAEAVDEERARGQVIINERDKWIVELIRERDEAKAILQDAVSEAVPDAMIFAGHPDARRYSKALDGLRIWTARARTFLSKEAERG